MYSQLGIFSFQEEFIENVKRAHYNAVIWCKGTEVEARNSDFFILHNALKEKPTVAG